jgi:hypothetical protein
VIDDRNGEPISRREARALLVKKMSAEQVRVEVPYVVWEQRDGTPIRVKDMDDRHLYNTIRMLERTAEATAKRENEKQFPTDPDVPFYELTREQCIDRPIYHAMVAVATARGIDLSWE